MIQLLLILVEHLMGQTTTVSRRDVTSLLALTAVHPNSQKSANMFGNYHCTGIFVTNLDPQISSGQMEPYLWKQIGHSVVVEKLQTIL